MEHLPKTRSRTITTTIAGLAIGLGIVFGLTQFSSLGVRDFIRLIADVDHILLLNILVLTVLFMLVAAGRWRLSLSPFKERRPPRYLFLLHYSNLGILLGQFINTWGTAGVKAVALHIKCQYTIQQITVAAIVELLASNIPNVILASGALFYLLFFTDFLPLEINGKSLVIIIACVFGGASLAFVSYRTLVFRRAIILPLLERFWSSRLYKAFTDVFCYDFFRRIPVWKLTHFSLICVIINIVKAFLVLLAFQIEIPISAIVLAVCGLHFLTIFSLTPGGLGIYEAGFTGILVWFGAPFEIAIAAAIVKRLLDDLSVICFYSVVLTYVGLKRDRFHDLKAGN